MRIDRIRVGVANAYLIRDRGAILVDTGEPGRSPGLIRALGDRLGRLSDIALILLTHGHADHAGNANELRAATRAPVAIHERDAPWVARGDLAVPAGLTRWGRTLAVPARRLLPHLVRVEPVTADLLLGDDGMSLDVYGVSGRVVATPGHTAGSISVLLATGDALVGDLAMNGAPFCWRPSLAVLGDDATALRESWRRIGASGARVAHPGHGRAFEVGRVRV